MSKSIESIADLVLQKLAENPLEGGKAEEEPDKAKNLDPQQLSRGVEVEMEHTRQPEVSKEIATDHLTEIPDYYTRLDEMEEEALEDGGEEEEEGPAPSREAVIAFLRSQPTPPDDDMFHEWAESQGFDTHKAEAVAYSLAKEVADGGLKKEETPAEKIASLVVSRITMRKTAEQIADAVLKKLSEEASSVSSSFTPDAGSGTTSNTASPPAPGQMGAAQPKRLVPMQKQN